MVKDGGKTIGQLDEQTLTFLVGAFQHERKERLLQIMFDADGCYLDDCTFSSGHKSFISGRYRDLFLRALSTDAAAFALIHNHPSGNPAPSSSDISITRHIAALCRALDVGLVDHIIIAGRTAFSMRKAGLI